MSKMSSVHTQSVLHNLFTICVALFSVVVVFNLSALTCSYCNLLLALIEPSSLL